MIRISPFLLLFLIVFQLAPAGAQPQPVASVMFYNVENLFDAEDDPETLDNEFLPEGDRRWTNSRLYQKLVNISKVILNTGSWEPPALIGLCEVENRQVLEKLLMVTPLKTFGYKIIHKESPDERGIDVALLYRENFFEPIEYRCFLPVPGENTVARTREILYVSGILAGMDTVHLFVNHWPSRYGGLMETRSMRNRAAARLKAEIEQLQLQFHAPAIIAMGDFNDQPSDQSLGKILQGESPFSAGSPALVNLSLPWENSGKGTLKMQSQWQVFDQMIVSTGLLDSTRNLFCLPGDARILDLPFLLEKDERFYGEKPFRSYVGFRYHGGFSDHLPVILTLRKRQYP